MNIQQEQKLKELIRTSLVLNDIERQEWLALLGLMNDKQVFELEKILSTHLPPAGPSAVSVTQPRHKDAVDSGQGHILNMPHPAQPGMKDRPVSAFAGTLRAMLQEKELPAGEQPLELKGPEVIRPKPPVFLSAEKNKIPKPKPPIFSAAASSPTLKPPVPKKPPVPAAMAGLGSLSEEHIKPQILEHGESRGQIPQSGQVPNNLILNIEEIAQLSVGSWLKYQSMVQAKLIHYAATAGMHEVLFRLEKSPAFKAYIDTGLKLLSSPDKSFDKFVTEAGLGPQLYSKTQFEAFADMLRHIQAGK